MRRSIATLIAIAALTIAITPVVASAAPAAPTACQPGAFTQYDLAGTYVGTDRTIRVDVFPCGGSFVEWRGSAGDTWAVYYSAARLSDGGIVIIGVTPGPYGYLDGVTNVGMVAAEPGYVQLFTVNQYAQRINTFRLHKIA